MRKLLRTNGVNCDRKFPSFLQGKHIYIKKKIEGEFLKDFSWIENEKSKFGHEYTNNISIYKVPFKTMLF